MSIHKTKTKVITLVCYKVCRQFIKSVKTSIKIGFGFTCDSIMEHKVKWILKASNLRGKATQNQSKMQITLDTQVQNALENIRKK